MQISSAVKSRQNIRWDKKIILLQSWLSTASPEFQVPQIWSLFNSHKLQSIN